MSAASLEFSSTPSQPRRSGKKHVLAHAVIIALALIMLYPVLWMISSSFKPSQLNFYEPGLWLRDAALDNWAQGWIALGIPFWRFFLNSAVIAVLSLIGNLFSCSLAAYVFARLREGRARYRSRRRL